MAQLGILELLINLSDKDVLKDADRIGASAGRQLAASFNREFTGGLAKASKSAVDTIVKNLASIQPKPIKFTVSADTRKAETDAKALDKIRQALAKDTQMRLKLDVQQAEQEFKRLAQLGKDTANLFNNLKIKKLEANVNVGQAKGVDTSGMERLLALEKEALRYKKELENVKAIGLSDDQLEKATRELKRIHDLSNQAIKVKFAPPTGLDTIKGAVDRVNGMLGEIGKGALRGLGQRISQGVVSGLANIASAPLDFVSASVGEFQKFSGALNQFATFSGGTKEEVKALAEEAKRLGIETSKTPEEAALAATELTKLGYSAAATKDQLQGVINLAESTGLQDIGKAASIAGVAYSVFGIDAKRAADVVSATANTTAANAYDIQQAFSKAGGVFKQNGQDVETLATAFGLLRNAGFDASSSATALKTSVLRLTAPTSVGKSALKDLGLDVYDSSGKMKNFLQLIPEFRSKLEKLTPREQNRLTKTIFGDRGAPAFLALMQQTDAKIAETYNKIKSSDGAAAASSKSLMGGLAGASTFLKGSFSTFLTNIGQSLAPAFEGVIRTVTEVLNNLLKGDLFKNLEAGMTAFKDVLMSTPQIAQALTSALSQIITLMSGQLIEYTKQFTEYLKGNPDAVGNLANQLKGVAVAIGEAVVLAIEFGRGFVEGFANVAAVFTPILQFFGALTGANDTTKSLAQSLGEFVAYAIPIAIIVQTLGAIAATIQIVTGVVGALKAAWAASALAATASGAAGGLAGTTMIAGLAPFIPILIGVAAAIAAISFLKMISDANEANAALEKLSATTDKLSASSINQANNTNNLAKSLEEAKNKTGQLTQAQIDQAKAQQTKNTGELANLKKQLADAKAVPKEEGFLASVSGGGAEARNNTRQMNINAVEQQIKALETQNAKLDGLTANKATGDTSNKPFTLNPGATGEDATPETEEEDPKAELADKKANVKAEDKTEKIAAQRKFEDEERSKKQAFEDQQKTAKKAFNDTEKDAQKAFDKEQATAKKSNDKLLQTEQKAFDKAQAAEKKAFEKDLNTEKKAFDKEQASERQAFERTLSAEKKRLEKEIQNEEKAFNKQQNEEKKKADKGFDKETKAVDRQLQLEEATPKERKKLEKEYAKEDKKEASRDKLMAPIEAKRAALEAKQEAEKEARELAKQAKLQALEEAQALKKEAYEAAQLLAKEKYEEEQNKKREAYQDILDKKKEEKQEQLDKKREAYQDILDKKKDEYDKKKEGRNEEFEQKIQKASTDFADKERQKKQAFEDQQRKLDVANAEKIRDIKASGDDKAPTTAATPKATPTATPIAKTPDKSDAEGSKGESRFSGNKAAEGGGKSRYGSILKSDSEGSKGETRFAPRKLFTGGSMEAGSSAVVNEQGLETFKPKNSKSLYALGDGKQGLFKAPMAGTVINAKETQSLMNAKTTIKPSSASAGGGSLGSGSSLSGGSSGGGSSLSNASVEKLLSEIKAAIQQQSNSPRSLTVMAPNPVQSAAQVWSDISKQQISNSNL